MVYSTIIAGSENITALAEYGGYNRNKVHRDGHPYSWLLERKIANVTAGRPDLQILYTNG